MVSPRKGIGETAAHYGVPVPSVKIRGHDAVYARVTRACEMFTADGEYLFAPQGEIVQHTGAAVAMNWVMCSRASGSVAGSGLEVLTSGPGGRVRTDHQFIA